MISDLCGEIVTKQWLLASMHKPIIMTSGFENRSKFIAYQLAKRLALYLEVGTKLLIFIG